MEWRWDWNIGQNTQTPSNSNIWILTKWTDISCAGQAHLRQIELPMEFSHKHFEEVQKLLLANLISQKLQEEVALREKERESNLHYSNHQCPRGLCALSFQMYLQIVHLHEGFFWVEGMFHYWCTRLAHFPCVLFTGPVCRYTNICKTQTPHESDCGIAKQSAASAVLCTGHLHLHQHTLRPLNNILSVETIAFMKPLHPW